MEVLLVQMDCGWNTPAKIRTRAEEIIKCSVSSDLVILPEMFPTGFYLEPEGVAEKADTVTLEWMRYVAAKYETAIAGSVAVEQDGKYLNRFYFVKPDGSHTAYDKRHLFTVGGENKHYTAGKERVIVEWGGLRILLLVCYDLRFPVFARNRGDYDMIIYVASWADSRIEAWDALLRARAIENQCYVAGVNRVGDDPTAHYNGHSALIDFKGRVIIAPAVDKEEAVIGTVDIGSLNEFRKKFPALNDADDFTIL